MSRAISESADSTRLTIHNLARSDSPHGFAEDVRAGLTAKSKKLFPKYFYDELGSALFEAICLLPEYYLTRAENEILMRHADEIVREVGGGDVSLIEMGSGSALKTRLIIEALLKRQSQLLFIAVDISASALETSSRVLLQSYPGLRINGYAGDYYDGMAALEEEERGATLALFLGSNLGNFDANEAHKFLAAMRRVLHNGDALLLGTDLRKAAPILEAAYDDALGVTAAFNLNQLTRINRELDADFDIRGFRHRAIYNEGLGRVEMYLESQSEQTVAIRKLEMQIHFAEGERIHTENSYKYDIDGLSMMAGDTGFELRRSWFDDAKQFSSNLFVAVSETD